MKRRFILVDTENVQNRWFELLGNLRKKDKIIVFYTENHSKKLQDYFEVSKGGKRLRWVECVSGENALDYQLLGVLSYLIYVHPKAQFIIYSNDKGYQETVKKWKSKGVRIKLDGFSTEKVKENVFGKQVKQESRNRQEGQQEQENFDRQEEQSSCSKQDRWEEQYSHSEREKWEEPNSHSEQVQWEQQSGYGKQDSWEGQNGRGKQEKWEGQNGYGRQGKWERQNGRGKQDRWEEQHGYDKQDRWKKQQSGSGNPVKDNRNEGNLGNAEREKVREELRRKQRNMPEVNRCVWEIGKSLSFEDKAAYHALLVDFLGQEEGRQQYQYIRKSRKCQEILKECCLDDLRERTIYLIQVILQHHSLDKSYGEVIYQILQEADLGDLQAVKESFDSRIGAKAEHQRYYSVMKKHFSMLKEMISLEDSGLS